MKGFLCVGLALSLGACVAKPLDYAAPGGGARRHARAEARRGPAPIMRPVLHHVSDSIPAAFPALEAPVADEAIYGPGGRPERVMRARLPPAGTVATEDEPEAPLPGRVALRPSDDRD